MAAKPNILFLMTDQMQGRVLDPAHPCITPNFDRLAYEGVRFQRAYTPNAVCSPARASLMTGLLPHNHGVLEVTHCVDDDQCCLRLDKPHWAQRLVDVGYRTGYFGKWHVERSNNLTRFGWQVDGGSSGKLFREHQEKVSANAAPIEYSLSRDNDASEGYQSSIFYGVTSQPPEHRGMGITSSLAGEFLEGVLPDDSEPWCCFVSVTEPHDPFICGEEVFSQYDIDAIELQPNVHDEMHDRPGIYRKAGRVWQNLTDRDRREAATCYYASITEIDEQLGRLIDKVRVAGQLDNTIIVLTSDHGELLGSHGLYCKNFSGFEEVYNIPLVMAGPAIAGGHVTNYRAGLHDLCPTLLELAGAESIEVPDSSSFAQTLRVPSQPVEGFSNGYAEYHGTRYRVTQRIIWDDPWKLVWNGFDFDELYNIEDDPHEMNNRIDDPQCADHLRRLMHYAWTVVRDTDDHVLKNSHYPILRVAPIGPLMLEG